MAGAAEVAGQIEAAARGKGISRLCHLTPLRNLLHIATGRGLLSVADLTEDERAVFDQQDLERLDNRPDHISCSIEYPNVWYLRKRLAGATPEQKLFPGWVCLLIDPRYLDADRTEFCVRNAAAEHGGLLKTGAEAFDEMFSEPIIGAYGKLYRRGAKKDWCPTDDQAEVMIYKHVPLAYAHTVVVADETEARRTFSALRHAKAPVEQLDFVVAPECFTTSLSGILARGDRPVETPWDPPA